MDNNLVAASWIGLALVAGLIAFRTGISASLLEIIVGVAAGNFLGLFTTPFVDFLAGFGSVLLTFLAGAEVDPKVLRSKFKESFLIGFFSFLMPFLAAFAFAYFLAGWDLRAAEIAGVALSTTSVAVVYAVMVETGLNKTELGKIILAACFITDLGTVVALGVLFANFDIWMLVFLATLAVMLVILPRLTNWFFSTFAGHMSELESRYIFLVLFGLGGLATLAKSEAVLPAYLVGLVLANVFMADRALVRRVRGIAFTFLTPFYFLKAGLFVSIPAVIGGAGIIGLLLFVKVAAKFVGVLPVTAALKFGRRDGMYTTLLMSTGLTFGTISALFGLTHGIIDRDQYTFLVTTVILSAIVPTLIAQAFFRPHVPASEAAEGEPGKDGERSDAYVVLGQAIE
ncbi:MAG: cation:proton antiporter [Dehalococcoidia bacterium]|nr:cation:proton antiporter [Dehalococcoidia bacterium]